MLKIIISFAFLFFLTGCIQKEGISANLYINSMGFDYNDEYTVYLYSSSSFDNVLNDMQTDDTNPQIGTAKGKGIEECLTTLETSMYERINYEHIETIILSKNFVDNERIEELILYLGNKNRFSINFFFYVTEDIRELYDVKSIDKASADNSLFLNPQLNTSLYENVSYVSLASSFFEKYRGIRIPVLITKEDIWSSGESKKVIVVDGVMYYNESPVYLKEDFLPYINNFNSKRIVNDSIHANVKDYSIKLKIENGIIKICANANMVIIINKANLTDKEALKIVEEEIYRNLEKVVELNKDVDVLNARDFLYRRGYEISNIKYEIEVNVQK